jgi:hypothetical protein
VSSYVALLSLCSRSLWIEFEMSKAGFLALLHSVSSPKLLFPLDGELWRDEKALLALLWLVSGLNLGTY